MLIQIIIGILGLIFNCWVGVIIMKVYPLQSYIFLIIAVGCLVVLTIGLEEVLHATFSSS